MSKPYFILKQIGKLDTDHLTGPQLDHNPEVFIKYPKYTNKTHNF